LAAPAAVVAELEAELPVLALLRVVVVLALLPVLALPRVVVVLALLPVLAHLLVEAEGPVEEVPIRLFSAAMVGSLLSPGKPRYAVVPRSGRKPKCRPCPLA
jgi:hypothetical protein